MVVPVPSERTTGIERYSEIGIAAKCLVYD